MQSNVVKLVVVLFSALLMSACTKEKSNPDSPIGPRDSFEVVKQNLVKAASKWIADADAKNWLLSKRTVNNRTKRLDEILILSILCADQGDSFVQKYNEVSGDKVSKASLSEKIIAHDEMLCIKIEYFFEQFLDRLDEYTPVVTDSAMTQAYFKGVALDSTILKSGGGDLILYFKLTEASNTVLYNPATHTFNRPVFYDLCDEVWTELANAGKPICSGEIPLSISEDIQYLYYRKCLPVATSQSEICDNGIDDDGDGLIDCADPDCCNFTGCDCMEICDNGIDDDGDGLIDTADPDCFDGTSPCMRDHYLEDNFLFELQLQDVHQLTGMGSNLCGGVISLVTPPASQIIGDYGTIYSSFGSATGLEEWYDFLIKIHWGNANGGAGLAQDLVYRFNIFELANTPDFTLSIYTAGQSGTGGSGGIAILTINARGLTETVTASLGPLLFFAISDLCGTNNWDPGILGDKVAISIHEIDGCRLDVSTGTVSTSTETHTYNSSMLVSYGLNSSKAPVTGGVLYKNAYQMAISNTNTINISYQISYSDDYYMGQLYYAYCWTDQGTEVQVHEIPFGNILFLRTSVKECP